MARRGWGCRCSKGVRGPPRFFNKGRPNKPFPAKSRYQACLSVFQNPLAAGLEPTSVPPWGGTHAAVGRDDAAVGRDTHAAIGPDVTLPYLHDGTRSVLAKSLRR